MVLIADAHVSEARGNDGAFKEMLDILSASSHDVVFLGDILDLWIALPRYEGSLHAHFLEWCREESSRRTVGFVEGNHEFFVERYHGNAFSFVSPHQHMDESGRMFMHGDRVNRSDLSYRVLRFAVRNPLTRWLEQITPRGPAVAQGIKQRLNARRQALQYSFPETWVRRCMQRAERQGATAVYMGHFHDHRVLYTDKGTRCEIVPAWADGGQVLVVESADGSGSPAHWREL